MHEYLIPLLLGILAVTALHRREAAWDILTDGARDGLRIAASMVPSLVLLLSAGSMLRASGALECLSAALEPFFRAVGIPPQTLPLILIRPFSGTAALAVGTELIGAYGPDSLVGRTAAVMLGSTETTFYVISVYFGACGVRRSRCAAPAALCADAVGFWMAAATVRWFPV